MNEWYQTLLLPLLLLRECSQILYLTANIIFSFFPLFFYLSLFALTPSSSLSSHTQTPTTYFPISNYLCIFFLQNLSPWWHRNKMINIPLHSLTNLQYFLLSLLFYFYVYYFNPCSFSSSPSSSYFKFDWFNRIKKECLNSENQHPSVLFQSLTLPTIQTICTHSHLTQSLSHALFLTPLIFVFFLI